MNDSTNNVNLPIVRDFDKVCFEYGDRDAIILHGSDPVSYFELQEHSKALSYQLYHRFGCPDYILIDCEEFPVAEAIATLACMRINRPFVPVSSMDQHRPGRMDKVVELLSKKGKTYSCRKYGKANSSPSIVAVVVCDNDRDPRLSVFEQAGVHRILYLSPNGELRECLSVPETLPFIEDETSSPQDDMYVMFTSGTTSLAESGTISKAKAVVGSHRATHSRLSWFLATFSSSPRIGRRTKLTFVDGVTELWGALLDPMNVLVSVPPLQLRARGIVVLIDEMKCSQLLLLPSQASQLLLASSNNNPFPHLQRVIVSGEVFSPTLFGRFRIQYPKVQLINLYGQTETTGDCLCAVLTDLGEAAVVDNIVAVGKPIMSGFQITFLDDEENEGDSLKSQNQKNGNKQLVIKGSHLSNGYLGDSSFFDHFIPGDIGFQRNGVYYVRGRVDDIRKINGVLTSPSEVEAAFCNTYHVSDCATVAAVMLGNEVYLLCTSQDVVHEFSRFEMHTIKGIPLNLIPKQVFFVHGIPRSSSGAKKIDRNACLNLVKCYVEPSKERLEFYNSDASLKRKPKGTVLSIISAVLGVNESELDRDKSFLELGGDSASSITLLYRIQQETSLLSDLNATDILWSESLHELENLITGKAEKPKKTKMESEGHFRILSKSKKFVAGNAVVVNTSHRSVSLRACVDSAPLHVDNSIVAACQGGTIVKFNSIDGVIEGSRYYPGWMFQADLLLLEPSTLLVAGHSLLNRGIVLCLTQDLKEEKWKIEFDGSVKSRPILLGDKVWILAGKKLCSVDLTTGKVLGEEFDLPRTPCVSNPITITDKDGQTSIVFASSDWEGGIIVLDVQKLESKIYVDCEIGPVHKDVSVTKNSREIFISDIYGSLHVLNIKTMKLAASIQLSHSPLSAATIIDESTVVVGSYNGQVYCVRYDEKQSQLVKQWECSCYSSIYSKPLALQNGSILVCTTAGYVVRISIQKGKILFFYMISAEIWSSPVQTGPINLVAVGARDSKCHLISLEEALTEEYCDVSSSRL
uniref:Carrier domain-containing protein n=1 Tax=Pseudo-nitzschia multistriata TaxID=183589 RepID=A0A448YYU0_9STRA